MTSGSCGCGDIHLNSEDQIQYTEVDQSVGNSLSNPIVLFLLCACFSCARSFVQALYIILSMLGCRDAAEMPAVEMDTEQEASTCGVCFCGHKDLI